MYKALFKILKQYWSDYGGSLDLIKSPFTHVSAVFTVLYMLEVIEIDWRSVSIASLPTMLGFSLAAYTITFTLMGSALHRALTSAVDKKANISLVRIVNATFFHVVFFQSIGLLYSLLTKGDFFWRVLGGRPGLDNARDISLFVIFHMGEAIGCFLSVYSFFLMFSVAIAMFRLGNLSGISKSESARGAVPTRPSSQHVEEGAAWDTTK